MALTRSASSCRCESPDGNRCRWMRCLRGRSPPRVMFRPLGAFAKEASFRKERVRSAGCYIVTRVAAVQPPRNGNLSSAAYGLLSSLLPYPLPPFCATFPRRFWPLPLFGFRTTRSRRRTSAGIAAVFGIVGIFCSLSEFGFLNITD